MTNKAIAFFKDEFIPLEDAKISVMTHGLNYGTGIFEGIRGYYNPDSEEIYLFRIQDHYVRFLNNCKLLKIEMKYCVEELSDLTAKLVRENNFKTDIYIRPLAYKNACQIGTKLSPGADFTLFAVPMGDYIETSRPLDVCISSWRRVEDNAIPARGKICGAYVNSALAATEARDNGFDEAIVLNEDGHVAEGAAMNIFLVRNGKLITPPVYSNILEGITSDTISQLASNEFCIETECRPIDRTELYIADEIILCGTGAQIAAVRSVDRRIIGNGAVGTLTSKLQEVYSDVVKGRRLDYKRWITMSYQPEAQLSSK